MYFADLHVHTKTSDCSMEAEEILKVAKEKGITHIAFTDHDTTQDAEEHRKLAEAYEIHGILGIEMSAYDFKVHKKVHILGYGYSSTIHIEEIGRETLRRRNANCLKQIEILNELGYCVPVEEVQKFSRSCIYKQHILDYLIQTGQTEKMFGEIYKNIFKNGGPCDFDIEYPAAAEVVEAIREDGGAAVLAHPGQQGNFEIIPGLVEAGLRGIEWNHPSHGEEDKKTVEDYAERYHLFLTGGSDFHGKYEKQSAGIGKFPAHESSRRLF